MKIDVREAALRTATVEIKSLTVTGKQVTLAVFRQLQDEPLMADDCADYEGIPWGRVNYCPDRSCREEPRPHLHIVWQKGNELRRARFDMEWSWERDQWGPMYHQRKAELLALPQLFIAV